MFTVSHDSFITFMTLSLLLHYLFLGTLLWWPHLASAVYSRPLQQVSKMASKSWLFWSTTIKSSEEKHVEILAKCRLPFFYTALSEEKTHRKRIYFSYSLQRTFPTFSTTIWLMVPMGPGFFTWKRISLFRFSSWHFHFGAILHCNYLN